MKKSDDDFQGILFFVLMAPEFRYRIVGVASAVGGGDFAKAPRA